MDVLKFTMPRTWQYPWITMLLILPVITTSARSKGETPEAVISPSYAAVGHHGNITLNCTTNLAASSEYYWSFNDMNVTPSVAEKRGIDVDPALGTLTIPLFRHRPSGRANNGRYACYVKTPFGTLKSDYAILETAVIHHFPHVAEIVHINATLGNTAVIPCSPPHGTPKTQVMFQVNGSHMISQNTGHHRIMPSGNLHIADVRLSDQGEYQCIGVNPVSATTRRSQTLTHLHVVAPTIRTSPQVVQVGPNVTTAKPGDDVTLECVIQGSPVPIVVWEKYGGDIMSSKHSQVFSSLVLHNVDVTDSGTYICKGKNDDTTSVSLIHMVTVEEVATFKTTPRNKSGVKGSAVQLECSAEGQAHLSWSFDGHPIEESNKYEITDEMLKIHDFEELDVGIYQCSLVSRNNNATASAIVAMKSVDPSVERRPGFTDIQDIAPDAFLGDGQDPDNRSGRSKKKKNERQRDRVKPVEEEVDDYYVYDDYDDDYNQDIRAMQYDAGSDMLIPPSAPIISKLSDTSVMLEWTVPLNEGLPITFFKVQHKHITKAKNTRGWKTIDDEISPEARQYEVSGLQPGGTYKFRIAAVFSNNDNKQGPNSEKFTLKVAPALNPRAPEMGPRIVSVKALSSMHMAIKWVYTNLESEPIEGFHLYYAEEPFDQPFKQQTIIGRMTTAHLLEGLKPNTYYKFYMESFNSGGASKVSNEVVQLTLKEGDKTDILPTDTPVRQEPKNNDPAMVESHSNGLSTKASSELLYLVLGVVLGLMVLILIIFMALCAWKQRQQRMLLSNISKFQDPSKVIHDESFRKKQAAQNGGLFLLNGLRTAPSAPPAGNGVPTPQMNGHVGFAPSPGSHININVNPMDSLSKNQMQHSYQDLDSSHIREMLPPPPSNPPPNFPEAGEMSPIPSNTSEHEYATHADLQQPPHPDSFNSLPPGVNVPITYSENNTYPDHMYSYPDRTSTFKTGMQRPQIPRSPQQQVKLPPNPMHPQLVGPPPLPNDYDSVANGGESESEMSSVTSSMDGQNRRRHDSDLSSTDDVMNGMHANSMHMNPQHHSTPQHGYHHPAPIRLGGGAKHSMMATTPAAHPGNMGVVNGIPAPHRFTMAYPYPHPMHNSGMMNIHDYPPSDS